MGLRKELEKYADKGMVSFHMPGHKGKLDPIDLTELPDLDDLYDPDGMIEDALKRAAAVYGSEHCFYLVNGSTVGVLTAVSAGVTKGGHMIMQRGSHKSAYHAAILRDIKLSYIFEDCDEICGAGLGVSLSSVKEAVLKDPEAEAVFLTSPSYEGFCAELEEIAAYLHSADKKLIVDAAHGAHFALCSEFPQCAVAAGADYVVMSLHKTLPCPNQAALLHVKGDPSKAAAFLSIYQTTSPSYPLMAAMDDCINARYDWEGFILRRRKLSEQLKGLKNIRVRDAFDGHPDRSPEICKMMLCPADGVSGIRLHEELRLRGIEPEMSLPAYVLLICSVADTDEDHKKLAEAVKDIDSSWQTGERSAARDEGHKVNEAGDHAGVFDDKYSIRCIKNVSTAMSLSDAWEAEAEDALLAEAAGRISAGTVMAYPPGRPILLPGEQITAGCIEEIFRLLRSGCSIKGISMWTKRM